LFFCQQVGDRLCHHGYRGDIVTGPFLAYCLDCEDEKMLRVVNGLQLKRAADIAERNVFGMMFELHNGRPFVAPRSASLARSSPDVLQHRKKSRGFANTAVSL
jgi:hypothetical protein